MFNVKVRVDDSGACQRSERLGGVDVSQSIQGQLPAFGRTIRQRTLKFLRSFPELAPSNSSIFLVNRFTPKARYGQALLCRPFLTKPAPLFSLHSPLSPLSPHALI